MLKQNVGGVDRIIRIILGVVLLAYFVTAEGSVRWVGLLGLIPLLTAAMGSCPLYSVLGISTCPVKRTT